MSKLQTVLKALESCGWKRVHRWDESHGNGSTYTLEEAIPPRGFQAKHLCVAHGFDHDSVRVYSDNNVNGSYLLAQAIAEDQKLPEDDREWTLVNSTVSHCCTAEYTLYRGRYASDHGPDAHDHVMISHVAGHGSQARWVRNSDAV